MTCSVPSFFTGWFLQSTSSVCRLSMGLQRVYWSDRPFRLPMNLIKSLLSHIKWPCLPREVPATDADAILD